MKLQQTLWWHKQGRPIPAGWKPADEAQSHHSRHAILIVQEDRMDTPEGYESLASILDAALEQASRGKGDERHANGLPFLEQPMLHIGRQFGVGFPLGQAVKKAIEAQGMLDRDLAGAAERELLGAINYLAGAILLIREAADVDDHR